MRVNPLLLTDSYKHSHYLQDPENTQFKFSYLESRGGLYNKTVMFGLQIIIKEYLTKGFKLQDVTDARTLCEAHGVPFNYEGWKSMWLKHGGNFPVEIRAIHEGAVVPVGTPLITVINTDPEFPWITAFLESIIMHVWYTITVATTSYEAKKLILDYLSKTGDSTGIDFKLHDFGFRGVSSVESAGRGGLAHLTSFKGTDTMPALAYAKEYYQEDMAGFSIPASEHSTITIWGKEKEAQAYANMIKQFGNSGHYAVVSDSYDIYNAVENIWGSELKDQVLAAHGTLVVRPDSGHPAFVVLSVLRKLGDKFGFTVNEKGYKVLNKVRVIQGDGVNLTSIKEILLDMKEEGWSADNVAFGMGGALLQKCDRDTQKFAYKCSAAMVDGLWRDVYKDPITDSGKRSKRGLVGASYNNETEEWETVYADTYPILTEKCQGMYTVFRDGEITASYTLDWVRKQVDSTL